MNRQVNTKCKCSTSRPDNSFWLQDKWASLICYVYISYFYYNLFWAWQAIFWQFSYHVVVGTKTVSLITQSIPVSCTNNYIPWIFFLEIVQTEITFLHAHPLVVYCNCSLISMDSSVNGSCVYKKYGEIGQTDTLFAMYNS